MYNNENKTLAVEGVDLSLLNTLIALRGSFQRVCVFKIRLCTAFVCCGSILLHVTTHLSFVLSLPSVKCVKPNQTRLVRILDWLIKTTVFFVSTKLKQHSKSR